MLNAKIEAVVSTPLISREGNNSVSIVNGDKIAELRRQRGWGQRDLAAEAQIDPSVISRLERNLQDDCMLSIVIAIAEALGVTVDELLSKGQHATYLGLAPEL